MDLVAIARHYVDRMLREVPGMKALILDGETTQTISEVYSQTEIMNAEVYLVERLDAGKTDKLPHLKVPVSDSLMCACGKTCVLMRPNLLQSCDLLGGVLPASHKRERRSSSA